MHDAIELYHNLCGLQCVYVHTDSYGGTLAGEDEASYLFSDDATAKDTIRYVYCMIQYMLFFFINFIILLLVCLHASII